MVYYDNIPPDTEKPSDSAGKFRSNFSDLNSVFNVDHVNYTQAENRGKHRNATILTGGLGATGTGEGQINVVNTGGTREYAYYQRESSLINIPFSMIGGFARVADDGTVQAGSFNLAIPGVHATGLYDFTITRPMANSNYMVLVTAAHGDATTVYLWNAWTVAPNNFIVTVKNTAGANVDPTFLNVLVIGEIS